jgi:type IV secretion system protein VirB9
MIRLPNILGLTGLLTIAMLSWAADARQIPGANRKDARMRSVVYDRGQVVRLSTVAGTALVVTFSAAEKITAVAVTDSKNLAAMPRDNFLFLKSHTPLAPQPVIVLTQGRRGMRRYVFEIEAVSPQRQAAEHRDIYYSVEFRYPGDEAAARAAVARRRAQQQQVVAQRAATRRARALLEQAKVPQPTPSNNWRYVAKGSRSLMPAEVYDNGYSTFFRFPGAVRVPAIFRINPDGREATANTSVRGDYVVVSSVASGWRLRDGRTLLSIWNRAYDRTGNPPDTGTVSPAVMRVVKGATQ